jgi:phenylalanyl-tRNA synthetase beta chain
MLFSLPWLRALCPVEAEAADVARALSARGLVVDALDEREAGVVLDVDVPANRPDCLGHRGVARELGAAFSRTLAPAPAPVGAGSKTDAVHVEIEAPDLCARYTARCVRDVRIGPSPSWVVARLEACGLRTINNVVDASNLVLLELGQPVHFFDAARIAGRTIRVRRAVPGEKLRTLDGVDRVLDPQTLVIADAERATALAGIIGGATSEITHATREVLIEAAWFDPRAVRRIARRLALRTDASWRFERGADIEAPLAAQELAARLLVELAGGVPGPVLDVYPEPRARAVLRLRPARIERLLGYAPPIDQVLGALGALSFEPRKSPDGQIEVRVPSWRLDIEREEDLIEEVARHLGYDAVPVSLAGLPHPTPTAAEDDPEESARSVLARLGFHESFGYAMIGAGDDVAWVAPDAPAAVALSNPIAEPLAFLRRSLLPGLLQSIETNQRRGTTDVRLFEVGRTFWFESKEGFPRERRHAAVAWCGAARPPHWADPPRAVGYADIAGVVDHVLGAMRPAHGARLTPGGPQALDPSRSATWRLPDGSFVANAGALQASRVWVAEIDLESLAALPPPAAEVQPLPRLSPVARDLSLQMAAGRPFGEVLQALAAVPAPAPVRIEVVDRYEGAPLPPGDVSITVRVTLSPDERTLVEAEIEAFRRALVRSIAGLTGVRLRGE